MSRTWREIVGLPEGGGGVSGIPTRPDPTPAPAPTEPPPGPGQATPPTSGTVPSEEPGFGDVLSRLFTPPEPVVVPTPYGEGGGGSPALLGLLTVGALGAGAWYLWRRSREA